MLDANRPTPSVPAVGRDSLRLVLFGMPAAGKSSLLGALAQSAQMQEHLLNGRLSDASQGLKELQQRLYDEAPRRTVEEIVPYPIAFEPFTSADLKKGHTAHWQGLLIDCDGRVANDLLVRRRTLTESSTEGTLEYEVLQADTLILVIDAAAPPAQVDADFVEFGRFLRLLEHGRGQRSEVSGFPVFLVLTKCDLLAQPDDTSLLWLKRIEERKRQVDIRFRDFLKHREAGDKLWPFGRIDLHLAATAVKRPALRDIPAKPREPYGVAELFRQCLDAARAFRRRRRRSTRRLFWTLAGAGGLLLAMILGALQIIVFQASPATRLSNELQNKIDMYRMEEGQTLSVRLKGTLPQLRQKRGVLKELQTDPYFEQLPAEQQEYVRDRLQELDDYIDYLEKLQELRPPAAARNLQELQNLEETLQTRLKVPHDSWSQTEAARQHEDWLADIKALRRAMDEVIDWYQQKKEEGDALASFARWRPGSGASLDWRSWQLDVRKLSAAAEQPPFRASDRLRSPNAPTYGDTVFHFEHVIEARRQWERTQQRLEQLFDLSTALGLGEPFAERPQVLAIPAPPQFTLEEARARLQEMRKSYPFLEKIEPLSNLPEAARADLHQAARVSYRHLLEPGRQAVLQQLQRANNDREETRARWQTVQRWLSKDPEELAPWRILARVLQHIRGLGGVDADPVQSLLAFLNKDPFELEMRRFTLKIPRDLKVRPAGNLMVLYEAAGAAETPLTFEQVGKGTYDAQSRTTLYTFRAVDRPTLLYHPGDGLWAKLPLKKEGDPNEWLFSWLRGHSVLYQFEHLQRGAWLHPANAEATTGTYSENLQLSVVPPQGIPPIPDLMPVVKLQR